MENNKIDDYTPSNYHEVLRVLFEEQIASNERMQAIIKELAESRVEAYINWWKPKQLVKIATGDKKNAGIVHPIVRVRKNTGKVYIPWVSHKYKSFKIINPKWSTEIPYGSTGYSDSKLRNNSHDWEAEKAIETEAELSIFRKALHNLHEQRVQTLKFIKKLDKSEQSKSALSMEKKNEL